VSSFEYNRIYRKLVPSQGISSLQNVVDERSIEVWRSFPKADVAPFCAIEFRRYSANNHLSDHVMENAQGSESDEEQGDFLNFSEDLVELPNIKAPGMSEVDFDGLLEKPLRLHEDLKEGCGGQLWPAGMLLAKYMLRRYISSMKGKTMSVDTRSSRFLVPN
jgi:hypothetical protein